MKNISKKIAGFCASGVLSCSILLVPSHSYSADEYRLSAGEVVVRLGEPCGGNGEWSRSGGPSSVLLRNMGELSFARLYESGSYEFTTNCCSVSAAPVATAVDSSGNTRIDSLMSSPDRVGFGARTTGGAAAGRLTVVTNLNNSGDGSLREALKDATTPTWIVFANSIYGGTIYLREPIIVHNRNITIDGAGAGITVAPVRNNRLHMFQFRGGNTIIHGITIDGNATTSTGLMLREGDRYWIDHVTVKNFRSDDALTIGQGSRGSSSTSEVTISNYHAHDTQYAILAGGNNEVDYYHPHRTTIHSSILSADDRNPRIKSNGTAHMFNNYIHSQTYAGARAGVDSVLYSQNNVFSALNADNPRMALSGLTSNGGRPGRVYTSGDVFLDRADYYGDIRMVSESSINLPYQYNLRPSHQVLDYVAANAGAQHAASSRARRANPTAGTSVPTTVTPTGSCERQTYTVDFIRRQL